MTLRHLKIFITVSDLGSMTAAAKALFIAQPTVSQAISELESHYGVKLFDRLAKRLYITDSGRRLLNYARHITALVTDMEHEMINPDKSGVLKVGASLTVGTYLLPKLVNQFAQKYPQWQVNAVTKNTQDIERLILQNAVDFAIVEGAVHTPEIVTSAFMDDHLVLVCGKTHPLYHAKAVAPDDLSKLRFIVREQGSGTRELFENMMAAHEINWRLAWECNGSDVLKSAAMNGIGIAVISRRLVENELKTGDLHSIRINGIHLSRKFSLVYHKNKYLTDTMKAFMDLCRQGGVQTS